MEWQISLAIVLVIPVILIPMVLIWYINTGGIAIVLKEAGRKKIINEKEARGTIELDKKSA